MVSERQVVYHVASALIGTNVDRDIWAKTQSANPDVKVYIGAPASQSAAGSGYVDLSTLANFAAQAQQSYSSFGGVMLWDISLAVGQCESNLGRVLSVLKYHRIVHRER